MNATLLLPLEKTELKKAMLEACIEKQQLLIDDFQSRIKNLLEPEGLGNEEEYDHGQQASVASRIAEVDLLNVALSFANQEMNILHLIKSNEKIVPECATLGAVVVTSSTTFFISVSIEQFEVDGQTFVGLSTHSPLYQTMRGRKKGQQFTFKGVVYNINDIF